MKFLDSLNFIPMPLKTFPKSFGVLELKKGYFPHLLNTLYNQNYTSKLPDGEYFDPDCMPPAEREEFNKWYEERQNLPNYNFIEEMVSYYTSGVDILHKCILIFR